MAGCLAMVGLALPGGADSRSSANVYPARGSVSVVLLFDRSKSMDRVAKQTFRAIKDALAEPQWETFPCDISYVARGFYAPRQGSARLPDGGPPTQSLSWFPPCDAGTDCTNSEVFEQFNEETDGGRQSFLRRVNAATRDAGAGLNRSNTPLAEAIGWAAQHPWPGDATTGISILLLATDGVPEFGVELPAPQGQRPRVRCAPPDVLVTDMRNAWLEARRQFSDIFVIAPGDGGTWPAGSDLDFLSSAETGPALLDRKLPDSPPPGCSGGFWKASPASFPLGKIDSETLRAHIKTYYVGQGGGRVVTDLSEQFSKLLEDTCNRSVLCTEEVCDGKDNDCDGQVDEYPCHSCEATPTGFPEVVAVGQRGRYWCSGVVISPHAVLTARHCLPADTVLVGESIHGAAQLRRAIRVHLPEAPPADVAVLELESPLDVPPPLLRRSDDATPPTSVLSHVGFGASTPDGELGFGFKHALGLDGRGWGCDREHALELGCDPDFEMFVPGSPGRDTCQGDSGGALYELVPQVPTCVDEVSRTLGMRRRLIGLTSRTMSSATVACGQGGIYTRLDQLAPWLDPVLEALRQRHAVQGGEDR